MQLKHEINNNIYTVYNKCTWGQNNSNSNSNNSTEYSIDNSDNADAWKLIANNQYKILLVRSWLHPL